MFLYSLAIVFYLKSFRCDSFDSDQSFLEIKQSNPNELSLFVGANLNRRYIFAIQNESIGHLDDGRFRSNLDLDLRTTNFSLSRAQIKIDSSINGTVKEILLSGSIWDRLQIEYNLFESPLISMKIEIEHLPTSIDHIKRYLAEIHLELLETKIEIDYKLNLTVRTDIDWLRIDFNKCPWIELNHSIETTPIDFLHFNSFIRHDCDRDSSNLEIEIESKSNLWQWTNLSLRQIFLLAPIGSESMRIKSPLFDGSVQGWWNNLAYWKTFKLAMGSNEYELIYSTRRHIVGHSWSLTFNQIDLDKNPSIISRNLMKLIQFSSDLIYRFFLNPSLRLIRCLETITNRSLSKLIDTSNIVALLSASLTLLILFVLIVSIIECYKTITTETFMSLLTIYLGFVLYFE